jgi:3-oxoacyl-[acyl-carrier-protein] synthase-3
MAYLSIPNITIKGISACVPKYIDDNKDYPIAEEDKTKLIAAIGVERKRIVDNETCTSDLCYKAAEQLIEELKWDKKDIDCLIFVTQTPDYILPATSCILQHKLGLSNECYTLDISLGCSGYVYGLSSIASILQSGAGNIRKALLLVGDTISKITSKTDKSTWPLFVDAGTATAIEYEVGSEGLKFHLATDGEGAEAIIVKDGGFRNITTPHSFKLQTIEGGIQRSDLQLQLDGMDVFSFGINKAPKSVNSLLEKFDINKDSIDFFTFFEEFW